MNFVSYTYDDAFMDYAARTSPYAAEKISTLLVSALAPRSVLDVGCAGGAWLAEWRRAGVSDYFGVDGDYVDRSRLLIAGDHFSVCDLANTFNLGRRFDLVQCLEVAEHVPESSSRTLIKCLADHAERFILFSAAPPGQGGEFHINEQTYDYWRRLLEDQGFEPFDFVRPAIFADRNISFWYRYNSVLYVRREHIADLPENIKRVRIADHAGIADISPLIFRLRKFALGVLPTGLQHLLSRLKARYLPNVRM
jgi:SAM-dependent methyltransferase